MNPPVRDLTHVAQRTTQQLSAKYETMSLASAAGGKPVRYTLLQQPAQALEHHSYLLTHPKLLTQAGLPGKVTVTPEGHHRYSLPSGVLRCAPSQSGWVYRAAGEPTPAEIQREYRGATHSKLATSRLVSPL